MKYAPRNGTRWISAKCSPIAATVLLSLSLLLAKSSIDPKKGRKMFSYNSNDYNLLFY